MVAKIRNFAQFGVLSDPDPCDIPATAWSMAINARFRNGKVTRSPVFRTVRDTATASPRYTFGYNTTSGVDETFVGFLNGTVNKVTATTSTDVSISGYAPNAAEGTWTHAHLADVLYVNREDRVPWALRPTDTVFQELSAWDSTWRTVLLRTCTGALIALNVTKGAVVTPTLVKTSSFALAGAMPISWDNTDPSTNATENILAEMEGEIVDACNLGNDLMIYGKKQTCRMTWVGGVEIFDYKMLPFAKGAINANCSVEVDGKNYVFGPDDIWRHDGISDESICEGRVRDFVFNNMNASVASQCFTLYDSTRKEVLFCFVSGDSYAAFTGNTIGCNRAAVFNLVNETWAFDDLPLVCAGARATLDSSVTYSSVVATYDTIGGSYQDQEDSSKTVTFFVGVANTGYSLSDRLYAYDWYGVGSNVSFPVDTNATKNMYCERLGIDFDELNVDLKGSKTITSIYPQGRIGAGAAQLQFSFGSTMFMDDDPTWTDYMNYGGTDYKLDFNQSGRFLDMKMLFADYKEVSFSGLDLDMVVTSER